MNHTAVLTSDTHGLVRSLADHRPDGPVVSLYLDVTGRLRPGTLDQATWLERELRRASGNGARRAVEHVSAFLAQRGAALESVEAPRGTAPEGLAVFADAAGVFTVVESPVPFEDVLGVHRTADIRPLQRARVGLDRWLVALVDRFSLRVLHVVADRVESDRLVVDERPRDVDDAHDDGRAGGFQHQLDEAALRHLRAAAGQLAQEVREWRPAALALGGLNGAVSALRDHLSHEVTELHPVVLHHLALRAPGHDVVEQLAGPAAERAAAVTADAVRRLADADGTHHAVIGLADTMAALDRRRVAELLVEIGDVEPGSCCVSCGYLAVRTGECPVCGSELVEVPDLVVELAAAAVRQDAAVHVVPDGSIGHLCQVGAITRY